jgi:hypothetical protein
MFCPVYNEISVETSENQINQLSNQSVCRSLSMFHNVADSLLEFQNSLEAITIGNT